MSLLPDQFQTVKFLFSDARLLTSNLYTFPIWGTPEGMGEPERGVDRAPAPGMRIMFFSRGYSSVCSLVMRRIFLAVGIPPEVSSTELN